MSDATQFEIAQPQHPHALSHTGFYGRFGKRVFDLLLCLVVIPVALPFICILWVLACNKGANGLFGHQRIGQKGREFRCYKIRTMCPDADIALRHHLARSETAAKEWSDLQKLSDDPRVTNLGHLLRKTCLDELPQIWNVLIGDMSFVGPRPITAEETHRYGPQLPFYLTAKPGVTGLWQALDQGELSYDDRVALDVAYCERQSFGFDLWIMWQTMRTVLSGRRR